MASLDLNQSYNEADNKLSALNTFTQVKTDINNSIQKKQNQLTNNFNLTKFQEQAKDLELKIKKQVQTQFQKLIGLLMKQKGSGADTTKFIIKKLVKSIITLKSKLVGLYSETIMKSFGCSINQTYQTGTFYIRVSSIDLFDILLESPDSPTGKLFYERPSYNDTEVKRSTNKGLYEFIANPNIQYSYKGFSSRELFKIQYVQTYNNDSTGWYKVTLTTPDNGETPKVIKFLQDYLQTVNFFDFRTIVMNILDAIFGIVSIKLNYGTLKIDDTSKFALIIQRILGLCFDNDQEISVSGQAKTPELDDIDDSFFELTNSDLSIVEEKTSQIQKRVVVFETCDNVEFPVDSDSIVDTVESLQFNDDGSNFEDGLDSIATLISNNPNWLQFSYPQISVTLNFNFLEKIPQAVVSTILNPKILLPFFIMLKSLGLAVNDYSVGLYNFLKNFSKFAITLISKIGREFVETLFNELKKDIQKLVLLIIRLIIKDESGQVSRMIERLISIATTVTSVIKDYRQCKSIIDAILQLMSLVTKTGSIPSSLLPLSSFLPGYSPNRAFIGAIEEMQKLGLPTGPLPDGSPNLQVQSVFAAMKSQDEEQKINGKLEAVAILPPPFLKSKVHGKSR